MIKDTVSHYKKPLLLKRFFYGLIIRFVDNSKSNQQQYSRLLVLKFLFNQNLLI